MGASKGNCHVMAGKLSQAIGRLIAAQDQERTRIARELHDDIGPSLAILGMDLLKMDQPVSGSSGGNHLGVQQIYEKIQEIGSRISRLSNQLQPPVLKYFGLAKAIDIECKEFSEKHKVPVSFSGENFAAKPDPAVALNIFRVVQEALSNACRHAHATGISVKVSATPTELTLMVSDNGVGFQLEQIGSAAGLGLISMRERMRLIGGEFEIWSQPGQGVKISCRVPMLLSGTAPAS
jgi:signal transduction histidine kinase